MSLDNIRVVLVSPIYGGNVGSVCRAMKNMGLQHLAIAAPRGPLDDLESRKMALHADDILANRQEYPTLAEAVADCGLVAGSTARPGLYRSHAKSPREWAPHLIQAAKKSKVALVFGTETDGLSNEDLACCTQIIRIPSSPEYPSLNLAQAVLICCYELFLASGTFELPGEFSPEASGAMREQMFSMWREALLSVGFMKGDKADHMMMGIRRILSRGTLTVKDIRILIGMARQVRWAGGQLKSPATPEP
ncbi:MAG: RNA methyltransferase [Kiritimatiellae bacterium]|nr:RNA methyltransferase [Kiritimatiellia bacterium]